MFSLNETTLLSAINSGSIFSLLNSALTPSWGITYNKVDQELNSSYQSQASAGPLPQSASYTKSGKTVFTPTGWISAEAVSDAMVVNSNIENGSFTSYNKIRRPAELRLRFAHEGWTAYTGAIPNLTNFTTLSITELLNTLEDMKNSASTYDIETPDRIYRGYDLIHYDYSKTAKNGQTLLVVSAIFQEILDIGEVTISSKSTNSPPSTNGTSSQSSAITTDSNQSTAKATTLEDVKNAWSSGSKSLSSALVTTGNAIVSGINSAANSISQQWENATTSISTQIKNGVSEFIKVIT